MVAVSVFSGSGGFDNGYTKAGGIIEAAYDSSADACEAYEFATGGMSIQQIDLNKINPASLPDADFYFGGPPCQDFSTGGIGRGQDGNRNLWPTTIRIIAAKRPGYFLFENVPGLIERHKDYFKLLIKSFKALDYHVDYKVLNAADYGVPQTRRRVFIAGWLKGNQPWRWPEPTHEQHPIPTLWHNKPKWVSWYDALNKANWFEKPHRRLSIPRWVEEFYCPRAVPEGLYTGANSGSNATKVHRRPDEPSFTITAQDHTLVRIYLNGQTIWADREATCILQGLPVGIKRQEQIGNAVPPLLAQRIFEANQHIIGLELSEKEVLSGR